MRIAVVGAGAMGQLFGARLALADHDVALIDTAPATIEAINANGIIVTAGGHSEWTAARAGTAADFDGSFDLILLFTKGFHTTDAVRSVRHLIGPDTAGLTLQNGLGNADVLARHFGDRRTWMGTTDYPADMRRPGLVYTSADGKIRVGPYLGDSETDTGALVALLNAADLDAVHEPNIQGAIWEKVAFNAALNTLSAVTGRTVGQLAESAECRSIVAQILDETLAVATALHIDVSRHGIEHAIDNAFANHTGHKPSMLQDREAGRRLEIDSIGGAIVRHGQQVGVPTPVLWTLNTLAAQAIVSMSPELAAAASRHVLQAQRG